MRCHASAISRTAPASAAGRLSLGTPVLAVLPDGGLRGGNRVHVPDLDPVRLADVADSQRWAVLEMVAIDCHAEDAGQIRGLTHVRVISELARQHFQGVRDPSSELGSRVTYLRGISTFTPGAPCWSK